VFTEYLCHSWECISDVCGRRISMWWWWWWWRRWAMPIACDRGCADGADTICILYSLKGLSLPKWLIAAQVVEAVEKCISSRYKIQMQCATRLFITYTLFHYFRWHFCKSISPALLYISYTWSFLMLDHLTWTFDVFTFGLAQNKPRDLGTRSCRSLICSI